MDSHMYLDQFSCRWSYGANRVQVEADVRILNDFLELLQQDARRDTYTLSSGSLAQPRASSRGSIDLYSLGATLTQNLKELRMLITF